MNGVYNGVHFGSVGTAAAARPLALPGFIGRSLLVSGVALAGSCPGLRGFVCR